MQPPTFRKLRCQPGRSPGAWVFAGPWWWPYSSAVREEFRAYVDSLRKVWPNQFLWIEGEDGREIWRRVAATDPLWERDSMEYGSWVLVLFAAGAGTIEPTRGVEWVGDVEALRLAGAEVAIISGPDDNEWEMVFSR